MLFPFLYFLSFSCDQQIPQHTREGKEETLKSHNLSDCCKADQSSTYAGKKAITLRREQLSSSLLFRNVWDEPLFLL
jgi:hypothetical protein